LYATVVLPVCPAPGLLLRKTAWARRRVAGVPHHAARLPSSACSSKLDVFCAATSSPLTFVYQHAPATATPSVHRLQNDLRAVDVVLFHVATAAVPHIDKSVFVPTRAVHSDAAAGSQNGLPPRARRRTDRRRDITGYAAWRRCVAAVARRSSSPWFGGSLHAYATFYCLSTAARSMQRRQRSIVGVCTAACNIGSGCGGVVAVSHRRRVSAASNAFMEKWKAAIWLAKKKAGGGEWEGGEGRLTSWQTLSCGLTRDRRAAAWAVSFLNLCVCGRLYVSSYPPI